MCVDVNFFFGKWGVHFETNVVGTSVFASVYITHMFFDINVHI